MLLFLLLFLYERGLFPGGVVAPLHQYSLCIVHCLGGMKAGLADASLSAKKHSKLPSACILNSVNNYFFLEDDGWRTA